MPKGREKVPKRLLTKEMVSWQRQYKSAKKIAKAVEMTAFAPREILQQALFTMKGLLNKVPRTKIKELAQQPASEAQGEEE